MMEDAQGMAGRPRSGPERSHYDAELWAEFDAAARRPLEERFKYCFIKTHRPVPDDARLRAFDTMEEYGQWCERELPDWLGFGRVREDRAPDSGVEPE